MTLQVDGVLQRMQECVKRGDVSVAQQLGSLCAIPLSLSPSEVTFGPLISSGSESRVFKGIFHSTPVAIKQPIIRTSPDLDRFREEIKIMASLDHPSIIPILGARLIPPNYYFVMPLERESYYHLVHEKEHRPSWREVLEIATQITAAMTQVHSKGLIHRDIKTRNILRGKDGVAKLIDFGIACSVDRVLQPLNGPSGGFNKRSMVGTLEYMAPEVLHSRGHSPASDVYAFAVMINEIATGIYPYSDCTKENPDAHTVLEMGYGRQELSAAVAAEGLRPTLPRSCPESFSRLLRACWELHSENRPTFAQLNEKFSELLSRVEFIGVVEYSPETKPQMDSLSTKCIAVGDKRSGKGTGEWINKIENNGHNVKITCGSFETSGFRGADRMEDRHFISENSEPYTTLGIFDGHRGPEAAEFAASEFNKILNRRIKKSESAEEALRESFLEVEAEFEKLSASKIKEARGPRYPGCTSLVALVVKNKLFIANAGDCRAVMCRGRQAHQLSRDHTASDPSERSRIQKIDPNSVSWQKDTWRIGSAGLQVTRSLGDIDLKPKGVTADPEVSQFDISDSDSFLILASDGLWDTISNEEAVRYVLDTVKDPSMCAKRLASEALTKGSRDNVTVIVLFLKPVDTFERIYIESKEAAKGSMSTRVELSQISLDEMHETL